MAMYELTGKRKGKGLGVREFKYQGFRLRNIPIMEPALDDKGNVRKNKAGEVVMSQKVTKTETKNTDGSTTVEETGVFLPADVPSLKEVLDSLGGDEKRLTLAAAIGANRMFADQASDPFYGLIPESFDDEQRKSLKIAAREIMKSLKKTAAQAVKMILS